MKGDPTIQEIQAIPLAHDLGPGNAYGSARGRVSARTATLVRLVTSDGVVGWGECFGPPMVMVALVDEISESLVGQPVNCIEPFLSRMMQTGYHRTTGGLHVFALSGVEIAMWDAWGHTVGISVGRLLGGRARDEVIAYASTGYVTADLDIGEYADTITAAVEEGFKGAKVKVGTGYSQDRQRAEAAREQLGDDRYLMVDFNSNYTADVALHVLKSLYELDIHWAEEPVPPEDLAGFRRLRKLGTPLAGGEALCTRFGFRDVISERLLDVVQPDVCKCGGLSEARAIANLARTWNVRLSPHTWGGAIGQAATLQLLASIPDYPHTEHASAPLWFEFDRGSNRLRENLLEEPFRLQDGYLSIPDEPGLGVEVDVEAVEALRMDGGT